jgi:hypothetical protein
MFTIQSYEAHVGSDAGVAGCGCDVRGKRARVGATDTDSLTSSSFFVPVLAAVAGVVGYFVAKKTCSCH